MALASHSCSHRERVRAERRLVLKSEPFSPLYFKTGARRCGHPHIFKTMAPWGWIESSARMDLGTTF